MSLQNWKKLADEKTKAGQNINAIRKAIKQKKIADTMGEAEAERLFRPITSGLKELAKPQPIKRIVRKKAPGVFPPDYGINIEDEVPDYNLEDLFDEGVQPQSTKQIVPKPPSYDDVLKDLETGKKKMSIDPEYSSAGDQWSMPELEDPPEYEEDEVPDYSIFDEDRINETLDELGIANYDDIEAQLNRVDMTAKTRHTYLSKKIEEATKKRQQLPGYKTHITKQLNKGMISQAEAQFGRKVIDDTRKVLTDYINYNKTKLKSIKGSGPKTKRGGGVFFLNPNEAFKKLELITGSIGAGNNSIQLRNAGVSILDILFKNSLINKSQYNKIYKNFFHLE